MLTIIVPGTEHFDEETEEFLTVGDFKLELEHSLVTLSKWEAEFEKPFLGREEKSTDETLRYIQLMILTPEYPEDLFRRFSAHNMESINDYINAKMTATFFREIPGSRKPSNTIITSELIYYWMTVFNVPASYETWHLNRLFTLIRVADEKQQKPKKMNKQEQMADMRRLNAERRAKTQSSG